jgi:hypothetical protein
MLDCGTPRFGPIVDFEEFRAFNLALEPSSIVLEGPEGVTRDFEFPFLHYEDMVDFLSLLKKVLPSFKRLLFQIVAELDDRVLGQGSEAREGCHELGYL